MRKGFGGKHYISTLQIAVELGLAHSMVFDSVKYVANHLNMNDSKHFIKTSWKKNDRITEIFTLTRKGYHLLTKYGYLPTPKKEYHESIRY